MVVDIDVETYMEDIARTVALPAHQKGLELACDVDADVPRCFRGDATRLRQVLLNLLGNAVKFTETGEVSAHVWRAAPGPGGQFRIGVTVRDTGIGVPRERQAAIFDAFTQADGSTTRKYGGTGLGLTISARLVALMGGRLWLESEPGMGSRFHVEVPVEPLAASHVQAGHANRQPVGRARAGRRRQPDQSPHPVPDAGEVGGRDRPGGVGAGGPAAGRRRASRGRGV